MLAVLRGAFHDASRPLIEQPARLNLTAIGFSDADQYAALLGQKLSYTNTFFHVEPRLDLDDPLSLTKFSNVDLIVCSDVIEHTRSTPKVVLDRLWAMLRPGGLLVLCAPTYLMPSTIEWYPAARSIQVIRDETRIVVHWTTIRGVDYLDTNPAFHGGAGSVLEMRLISHDAIISDALAAGFSVETLEFAPECGYYWPIIPQYPGLTAAMDGRVLTLTRTPDMVCGARRSAL